MDGCCTRTAGGPEPELFCPYKNQVVVRSNICDVLIVSNSVRVSPFFELAHFLLPPLFTVDAVPSATTRKTVICFHEGLLNRLELALREIPSEGILELPLKVHSVILFKRD